MGKGKKGKGKVVEKSKDEEGKPSVAFEESGTSTVLATPLKATGNPLPPPFPEVDDKPESSHLPAVETQVAGSSPLPTKSPLVQFASVYPDRDEEEDIDFYIPPADTGSSAPMVSPNSLDMRDLYPNTEKQDEVMTPSHAHPQSPPHPSTPPSDAPSHPLTTPSPCRYSFISADHSLTEIVFERRVVEEEGVEGEGEVAGESVWRVVSNDDQDATSTPLPHESTPAVTTSISHKSSHLPDTSVVEYGEMAVESLTHILYTYAPIYLDIHTLTEYIEELMVTIPYIHIVLPTILIRIIKVCLIWSVMYWQFVGMCVWQLMKFNVYVSLYLPYSLCVALCVWIVKQCAYGAVMVLNGVGKKKLPIAVNGHHTKVE